MYITFKYDLKKNWYALDCFGECCIFLVLKNIKQYTKIYIDRYTTDLLATNGLAPQFFSLDTIMRSLQLL